jgi:DNA-binding response OmpR family regulator
LTGPGDILLIEDDAAIAASLVALLTGEGYAVRWHARGRDGLDAARAHAPDLVLLDLGLPDIDGVQVCHELQHADPPPVVVMLTARAQEMDLVLGLDAGADDYLTKPFRVSELLARVRAHLRRRPAGAPPTRVQSGRLVVDLGARRAWCDEHELRLRPKELELLALLVAEAGRAVTRERIMSEIWDANWFGSTRTLDQHVLWLRQKLAAAGLDGAIATLRGVGYRLERP